MEMKHKIKYKRDVSRSTVAQLDLSHRACADNFQGMHPVVCLSLYIYLFLYTCQTQQSIKVTLLHSVVSTEFYLIKD
jgi:hypothetical protein